MSEKGSNKLRLWSGTKKKCICRKDYFFCRYEMDTLFKSVIPTELLAMPSASKCDWNSQQGNWFSHSNGAL